MEYLEGNSLAQRLRDQGKLSLPESLEIATQLAGALDAAHALGVVHRDIKPANVMLVPSHSGANEAERAVITDFGLARVDVLAAGDSSSVSVAGAVMGTLAYMAPEQIQGEEVGAATGIYSFGLLLFEMVTGQKAFPGSQSVMAAMRRVTQPAPSVHDVLPEIPAVWAIAIQECLQIAQEDRPASAMAVVQSLQGELPLLPKKRKAAAGGRVTQLTATIISVLAVVALFGLAFRYLNHKADSHVAAGTLVYVAPAVNHTGEAQLDNVSQLINAGLAQSGQFNLLENSRATDILGQMTKAPGTPITPPVAREIAMRSGSVRVVLATITRSGSTYTLDVDIQQPDNTPARYREHWEKSFVWKMVLVTGGQDSIPEALLTSVRNASD
jgi:eukaryotic-like serine/threonine-protein kinase